MSTVTAALSDIKRTLRDPLAGDAALLAGSQYVATSLGFLTTVLAARLLGPADYGLASLIISYPMLVGSLVAVKSGAITTRYVSIFRTTRRHEEIGGICKLGYAVDLAVSLLAFALIAGTAPWVARHVYDAPDIAWLMVAYAACFPFWSPYGTSYALVTALQQFRWLAGLQVLDRAVASLAVVGLVLAGAGAAGLVVGAAVGNAVIGAVSLAAAASLLARDGLGRWWKASLDAVRPLRAELASFFGWNALTVTWAGLLTLGPIVLIGHLRGPEEAGFFRLATSLIAVGSYLEASMSRVAYPALAARWGARDGPALGQTLRDWTLRRGLPMAALMLCVIPLLPVVIPAAFGASFSAMVPGTQILMVGASVGAAFFWLNAVYYASGNIRLWTKASGVNALLTLGLVWPSIEQWGFLGLAALVSCSKAMFTLVMVAIRPRYGKAVGPREPAADA